MSEPITNDLRRLLRDVNDELDAIDVVHATLEAERQQGLVVHPFVRGTDKEAALKPLEEAAEAYAAWQLLDEEAGHDRSLGGALRDNLALEIADCVTACVNLAHRYGIDLQEALGLVESHNRRRGRYDG